MAALGRRDVISVVLAVVLTLLNARPVHKASPAHPTRRSKICTSSTSSMVQKGASPWLTERECGACLFYGAALHLYCSWRSEHGPIRRWIVVIVKQIYSSIQGKFHFSVCLRHCSYPLFLAISCRSALRQAPINQDKQHRSSCAQFSRRKLRVQERCLRMASEHV